MMLDLDVQKVSISICLQVVMLFTNAWIAQLRKQDCSFLDGHSNLLVEITTAISSVLY